MCPLKPRSRSCLAATAYFAGNCGPGIIDYSEVSTGYTYFDENDFLFSEDGGPCLKIRQADRWQLA